MGEILRLYPGPYEGLAVEDVYAGLGPARSGVHLDEPHVAVNMVSTLDGKVSVGGKASPIGSDRDRAIMRNIRCAFDAVVVGAGTVRAEEMNLAVPERLSEKRRENGLPEQPLGVILAGSAELPLERRIFRSEAQRLVVIAGDATPEPTLEKASALGVRVVRAEGSDLPSPHTILGLLKELLNVGAVLLEGGPTVNASFVSAGKVDELFLTLSPKISRSGEDVPTTAPTPVDTKSPVTSDLELASVHASMPQGELYLRYFNKGRR